MNLAFFAYELPSHLIAQEPAGERDASRLMVVERSGRRISYRLFRDLPDLLAPGDLLVLNDTRVLNARLLGRRTRTGGRWEGLFLRQHHNGFWELLSQTRGRLLEGETIDVAPGPLQLRLLRQTRTPLAAEPIQSPTETHASAAELLERFGHVPFAALCAGNRARIRPRRYPDRVRPASRSCGGARQPACTLHRNCSRALRERAIEWTFITLHVGLGTFRPIQVEDHRQHQMHAEWGELSADAAQKVEACRARNGRVIAVGTTAVRVLETAAATGDVRPWFGETCLFIYPPYQFHAVDGMITNFHLPRTTLLLMVSALTGVDLLRDAYMTAIEQQYRFYSYGDAMLIL